MNSRVQEDRNYDNFRLNNNKNNKSVDKKNNYNGDGKGSKICQKTFMEDCEREN